MSIKLIVEQVAYIELLKEIQTSLDNYKSISGDCKKNIVIEIKELSISQSLGYLY